MSVSKSTSQSVRQPLPGRRALVLLFLAAVLAAVSAAVPPPAAASVAAAEGEVPAAGAGWVPVNSGMGSVTAAAFDPAGSGIAYVGSALGTVFRSADRGATWTRRGTLPGISSLAIDPVDPDHLYAVTGGLSSSRDGGLTWSQVPGLSGAPAVEVAVAPLDHNVLYLLQLNLQNIGVLLRSADGGATWTNVSPPTADLSTFVVDPADPAIVYGAGLWFAATHDGGAHWQEVNNNTALVFTTKLVELALDPVEPQTLYASDGEQAFASTDGGVTWGSQGVFSGPGGELGFGSSGALYLYQGGTLSRSRQAFQTLRTLAPVTSPVAGLDPPQATVIAADPASPAMLLGFLYTGLLQAANGRTFTQPQGFAAQTVNELLAVPGSIPTGPLLLVGVAPPAVEQANHVLYASRDAGVTWTAVPLPGNGETGQAAVDAAGTLFVVDPPFLAASSDWGATWSLSSFPSVAALVAVPGAPGQLYGLDLAFSYPNGAKSYTLSLSVVATRDGGANWTMGHVASEVVPLAPPSTHGFASPLVVDPRQPTTLYVQTEHLYKSLDGGANLTQLPLPGTAAALVLDPASSNRLFAAVQPSGGGAIVYRSLDGGASWTAAAHDLPPAASATALACDPARRGTVYLATDHGLFVSHNAAGTWTPVGGALSGLIPTSLAILQGAPSQVFAGTDGGGVWRLLP